MRTCVLCGKKYEFCPTCDRDRNKPLWHKLYHDENCKNIFEALNNYTFDLSSKEETKEALSKCDLSLKLSDHYRNEIDVIMAESKKMKQSKKVEIEEELQVEIEPAVEF